MFKLQEGCIPCQLGTSELCARNCKFCAPYLRILRNISTVFFSSFLRMSYIPSWGVRLSVRLSGRSKSLLLLGRSTYRHQSLTQWSPGVSSSRVCSVSRSRSRDTGNYVVALKIASPPRQTCTQWSPGRSAFRVCSGSRSRVTWYEQFCCSA